MDKWPRVGERIVERLRAMGYWNAERGRPDVLRFSLDRRYIPTMMYKWIDGSVTPGRDNLIRLAKDLDVSVSWLLLGEGEVSPAPARPRKRARKALGCLAGALMMTATGMVPAWARTLPTTEHGHHASYRRRRLACVDRVFPDLIAA